MSKSIIKNPRKLHSHVNENDPTIDSRITNLENNEYKITYFTEISSSTGTITIPAGATILLDQFQSGADAYVSTIQNSQPTGIFPQTGGGITVDVNSFNTLGNYTLSGTPNSYPVALIYILKIKAKDYSNLILANILDLEEILVDSTFGNFINTLTLKSTPVDADYVTLMDSADSNKAKKLSWANIKAALNTLYQPLASELTSWASITRASGFDTFTTTPTSANLASLVTDETGTGALVFATNPTLSNPIVGTQAAGDNSAKAASTAYVDTKEMLLIVAGSAPFNPADAQTYYFGEFQPSLPTTAQNVNKFQFSMNRTITRVVISIKLVGASSNESVSFYLRESATTDKTITTSLDLSTISAGFSKVFSYTPTPFSVTSGTDYEFKIICPTWATNPTNVQFSVKLYGY